MASLLHSRFLLSPPSSPSDRLHISLIIGFTAGALSAALACLLFFSIHHCMFRLRRRHHHRLDPPSLPPAPGLLLLDTIPVSVYRSPEEKTGGAGGGGEDACCSVCLEDYQVGEEVRVLPRCCHVFHRDCIDRWLLTAASCVCPVCRGLVFDPPAPAAEAESGRDGAAVLLHNVGLAPQQLLL